MREVKVLFSMNDGVSISLVQYFSQAYQVCSLLIGFDVYFLFWEKFHLYTERIC